MVAGRRLGAGTRAAAGVLLCAACVVPSDGPAVTVPAGPPPSAPVVRQGPAFPRTAVTFLEQENLPGPEILARYDVVVLDSEWAHRLPPDFFTTLRRHNPDVVLLAYVNVVDRPPQLGSPEWWADRYALWQFESPVESRFPARWMARSGDGTPVSEWPGSSMTNLTDRGPRVNGQSYPEYAAEWVVRQVWSSGVWDGIFLDVWGDRVYGADRDRWDIDADGSDEPDSAIYGAGSPWERGIDLAERIMRARMPGAILVANGDRTLRGAQLDGRAWESFADQRAGRDPGHDLRDYVTLTAQGQHRRPGLALTINRQRAVPGSPQDHRRARFFLTATLLQNGYWAAMGPDYGRLADYDELDGAGRGPGYLGYPYAADPTVAQLMGPFSRGVGQLADGLFRRDFEHGIVLVNAGTRTRTVTLERPYRRLPGGPDPTVNDGRVVRTVSIPPRDGLILVLPA